MDWRNDDFGPKKSATTGTYPVHIDKSSGLFSRCEPLIGVENFKNMFLMGINLRLPNGQIYTDDILKLNLNWAMNQTEILLGTTITAEKYKEKLPFDKSLYEQYIQLTLEKGPVLSVFQFAIVASNGENIFNVPMEWLEMSNASKRQLNIIPLLAAYGYNQVSGSGSYASGGLAFLALLAGSSNYAPAYWEIIYTAGLSTVEGQVPTPVNDLIGTLAAIKILSEIAATNRFNSQSQSQDSISQSSSGPGPNIYNKRIEDLEKRRDDLVKKLKSIFLTKWIFGNI